MKTYRRKFAKKSISNTIENRKESRDGILWAIDISNKKCRVKIQGSNELIVAHYPRNQKIKPEWLRIGNAIRIAHREGVRGFIEVIGEGRAIPTPIAGETLPDPGGSGDGIVSGMVMTESIPQSSGVYVTGGTYRINNILYSFIGVTGDYFIMNDPAPFIMGVVPYTTMGQIVLDMDASPVSGLFRYDSYVVGINGQADYLKGDETSGEPEKPTIPSNHILIRSVLRVGGEGDIENQRIGVDWTEPSHTSILITLADEFSWNVINDFPETNLIAVIKDQYGNSISSTTGWILTLTKMIGTGQVWSIDSGYDDSVTKQMVSLSSYTFKYKRDQTASPETSPFFQLSLDSKPPLNGFDSITLLDVGGNPV